MKVYAVIGGFNYEGESMHSLRLFDCKSAAEEYKEFLLEDYWFDYVFLELKEVCMKSAIVTA